MTFIWSKLVFVIHFLHPYFYEHIQGKLCCLRPVKNKKVYIKRHFWSVFLYLNKTFSNHGYLALSTEETFVVPRLSLKSHELGAAKTSFT